MSADADGHLNIVHDEVDEGIAIDDLSYMHGGLDEVPVCVLVKALSRPLPMSCVKGIRRMIMR